MRHFFLIFVVFSLRYIIGFAKVFIRFAKPIFFFCFYIINSYFCCIILSYYPAVKRRFFRLNIHIEKKRVHIPNSFFYFFCIITQKNNTFAISLI